MNVGCGATENTENGMYGNQQGSAVTANAQRYQGGRCAKSIMSVIWRYWNTLDHNVKRTRSGMLSMISGS